MRKHSLIDAPNLEDIACLNSWPEGTIGHEEDKVLLSQLLGLMQKHGFGRIPQLSQQIEDLWRNPDKRKEYAQHRESRLKMLEEMDI